MDVYELGASVDDQRLAKAYPADNETAVENSCTHGHVDEWARMGNPRKVWQAIEPTMAGSCHIVTTGLGPTNYTSTYWRRCLAGDAPHHPCFVGALERPDRTKAWLEGKRRGMDEDQFRQEYPTSWEDALSGGGQLLFDHATLTARPTTHAAAASTPRTPTTKQTGTSHPARASTSPPGTSAATTTPPSASSSTSPRTSTTSSATAASAAPPTHTIQHEIEAMHHAWPGLTVIEDNAAGQAVRENLNLPEHKVIGFTTTASSKARIIQQLRIAVQHWHITWHPEVCPQLDAEMRGYQLPDDNVVQDSVIALAIALEHAAHAHQGGRILGIYYV